MVAFAFNANQYTPQYGGGGGLPAGKYKVVIVNSSQENVEKNGQIVGGYLALDLTPIEGPLQGQKHTDRLNLHHVNPKTVEIANKQLSAYCHVLNVHVMQDTQQLHNIPFIVEIGPQKNNPEYTEVKAIFDINGNEPGKAGAGPMTSGAANGQPQNPNAGAPAGGVQATGGGWQGGNGGGQPQGQQGGGWGGQQPQNDPSASQQQNGGGWQGNGGAPAGGAAGGAAGGGWSQNQGGGNAGWGAAR